LLFTTEGVRGRYLNELNRALAAEMAGAMASRRWEESVGSAGPCVVVAHDERPSSPDIVTGVGQALRRMGCQVVDIGLATRPCWMFAINHLQAAGGIQVTGSGCEPGMTGLDFVGQGGLPCSARGELDRIAERFRQGYSRPSRRPGSQRTFQASIPYEAGLWKHFHALRPLKIALACSNHAVRDVFNRIFRKLACRLLPVDTPTRLRKPGDAADPDLVRVSRFIGQVQADLGVLIEDDGEQCTFLDEQGRIAAPWRMAEILGDVVRLDRHSESVVVSDASREYMTRAMRRQQAVFGADGRGRYWFADTFPACDAILTVVHLLQALSLSDKALSRVVEPPEPGWVPAA
jgi:phosphomannomutase